ncbi:MAG: AAA family ATPase [Chloroflexota bacterium]
MGKVIYITGMSGTGKSTVLKALASQGHRTIDTDYDDWTLHKEGRHLLDEARLQNLLSSLSADDVLFMCGTVENQGKFYAQFHKVVLLSAPADVIIERVQKRPNNPYGKTPAEQAEILDYLETVEPLLRKGADVEINTQAPLEEIVSRIIKWL